MTVVIIITKRNKHHYHPLHLCEWLRYFSDSFCNYSQQWCKVAFSDLTVPDTCTHPTLNHRISISNWQMDGLMVYKMTHPSQGLNGVREHHSVWHAFLEPASHDLCVTGYSSGCLYFSGCKRTISAKKTHISLQFTELVLKTLLSTDGTEVLHLQVPFEDTNPLLYINSIAINFYLY